MKWFRIVINKQKVDLKVNRGYLQYHSQSGYYLRRIVAAQTLALQPDKISLYNPNSI